MSIVEISWLEEADGDYSPAALTRKLGSIRLNLADSHQTFDDIQVQDVLNEWLLSVEMVQKSNNGWFTVNFEPTFFGVCRDGILSLYWFKPLTLEEFASDYFGLVGLNMFESSILEALTV